MTTQGEEIVKRLEAKCAYLLTASNHTDLFAQDVLSVIAALRQRTPPTLGEEELREWAEKRADDAGRLAREVLALRQRADEATEACAIFLEDEAQREGDDHSAFTLRQAAAAIRARIARDPVTEA